MEREIEREGGSKLCRERRKKTSLARGGCSCDTMVIIDARNNKGVHFTRIEEFLFLV